MRRYKAGIHWILWLPIIVHTVQGVAMIIDPAAGNTTPTMSIVELFGSAYVAGVAMLVVSTLSAFSMYRAQRIPIKYAFVALMPQQILLLISALGAAEAVYLSKYADGVIRNQLFILADQFPTIAVAVLHSMAMIDVHSPLTLTEVTAGIRAEAQDALNHIHSRIERWLFR